MEDLKEKIADAKDDSPNLKEKTADLADHVEDLVQTFHKLAVVNITQKLTHAGSTLVVLLALNILGLVAFIFLGIALSLWIGTLLGNTAVGFLAGAGIFLVVLVIIVLLRKNIVFPFIRNLIIRKVYDKED